MIDLIIPYYNNPEGLARTLASINRDVFYVTVIDDSSTIYMPYNVDADQVLRYNFNRGPGFARQFGMNRTHNPYIMFLDTGDIFISKELQSALEKETLDNEANFISCLYYHYNQITSHIDNRMHGKTYKRAFLEKYNITFPLDSSYFNEDIGFNRTCHMIINSENLVHKQIDTPIIKQIKDINSLTQTNGQEVLYRDQTRALSLVTIHAVDICRQNNINAQEEINQIAVAQYYWFIRTAAERPEFLQQAWAGARIFYLHFQNEIQSSQLASGNAYLKKCIELRSKIRFPINILRFTADIIKNENLPDKYLT